MIWNAETRLTLKLRLEDLKMTKNWDEVVKNSLFSINANSTTVCIDGVQ